jgi:hypothetical protein
MLDSVWLRVFSRVGITGSIVTNFTIHSFYLVIVNRSIEPFATYVYGERSLSDRPKLFKRDICSMSGATTK